MTITQGLTQTRPPVENRLGGLSQELLKLLKLADYLKLRTGLDKLATFSSDNNIMYSP